MNTCIKPLKDIDACLMLIENAHIEKNKIKKDKLLKEINQDVGFYGLFNENNLIGMVGLERKNDNDYKLIRLAVEKQYRHNGYGEELIRYVENKAIFLGGKSISLGYKNSDTRLGQWYSRLGYIRQTVKKFGKEKEEICFVKKPLSDRPMLKPISNRKESCCVCGFPCEYCICNQIKEVEIPFDITMLMHTDESFRQTNTGYLIAKACKRDSQILFWERDVLNKSLEKLLEDKSKEIILVFPKDDSTEVEQMITFDEVIENRKKTVYIILDGTWKEVRKILRKTPALRALRRIELNGMEKTKYKLRRNKDLEHICTIEVAIELLRGMEEYGSVDTMKANFDLFIDNYSKAKTL